MTLEGLRVYYAKEAELAAAYVAVLREGVAADNLEAFEAIEERARVAKAALADAEWRTDNARVAYRRAQRRQAIVETVPLTRHPSIQY